MPYTARMTMRTASTRIKTQVSVTSPGVRGKPGAKRQDAPKGGIVAAVEIIANGLLAHPANRSLRQRVNAGELTPSNLSDACQRIALGMAVLHAAERRGLHDVIFRSADRDGLSTSIGPLSERTLFIGLESL